MPQAVCWYCTCSFCLWKTLSLAICLLLLVWTDSMCMFVHMQQKSEGTVVQQTAGLLHACPHPECVLSHSCFLTLLTLPLFLLCFCFGVHNIHCTFPPSRLSGGIAHILPGVFLVVAEASRKECVLKGGFAQRSRARDLIFQFTFSQLCILGKYPNFSMPWCFFI